MDKRKFFLKKDCVFVTNHYHIQYIVDKLLISTLFTLYISPTMYIFLTKNTKRIDGVDIQLN